MSKLWRGSGENYLGWTARLFPLMVLLVSGLGAEPMSRPPPSLKAGTSKPDDCAIKDYEAHCVLDILDEHIEATAIVNHCHIPLDITFRVVYRYGNGTDQRWQYTFVTTNQNERVPIPGLTLPPQPNSEVFLYVRVPQPIFDQHNKSLAAIEASFVAIMSEQQWEEVEFLNDEVVIDGTNDCFPKKDADPLLYTLGGSILGLLVFGFLVILIIWCYRKRKLALDELALVSSLETGLPGAQPYQVGSSSANNNITNPKQVNGTAVESPPQTTNVLPKSFKFGRLREEPSDRKRAKVPQKLSDSAVVIGNPVLVEKVQPTFNKLASGIDSTVEESVGDTFQNVNSVHKFERDGTVSRGKNIDVRENSPNDKGGSKKTWDSHPLEPSEGDDEKEIGRKESNGARPKLKTKASNSD